MKIKNVNLEYYIIRHNPNNDKFEKINIINTELIENIAKEVKKSNIVTLSGLYEYLKRVFMYYHWSKTEAEFQIGGLFSKYPNGFEKVDGWYQIENNLSIIVKLINNEMELNLK